MENTRSFTVKSVGGRQETVNVTLDDTFDSFCEGVRTAFGFEDDRRLRAIYNGTVLTADRFADVPDKATIICLATRPTSIPVSSAASASSASHPPTTTLTPEQVRAGMTAEPPRHLPGLQRPTEQNNADNPSYSFQQVKAFTVVFLNFISSNPQLRDAFLNNYGMLVTELVKNPQLEDIMKNILSQSGQIMEAMEKGENISVNINTDSNSMERIELTEQDTRNIDQLIGMGFNQDQAVVEYLKAGKSIQGALRALQNLQS